jgi:RimJ/RimL family protein N-acetyltransferase
MYHSKMSFSRAAEVLRTEGPVSLWFRILGETVYRRAILIERLLQEPIMEQQAGVNVEVSLLTAGDLDEYLAHRPGSSAADICERFRQGQKCFVARHQNTIASTCWAATGIARIDYLSCEIRPAEDEIYTYGSYTAPQFRNLNIAAVRGNEMVLYFRELGYRRFVAILMPENMAAFRPAEKIAYRRIGIMGYVKLGPWRHFFCRVRSPARGVVICGETR